MNGDLRFKVDIIDRDFSHQSDIYLYREIEGEDSLHSIMNSEGDWYSPESTRPKPTLTLRRGAIEKLQEAFLKRAGEKGLRTEPEAKLSGLLEATKAHLEDMRRLVFKEPKEIIVESKKLPRVSGRN